MWIIGTKADRGGGNTEKFRCGLGNVNNSKGTPKLDLFNSWIGDGSIFILQQGVRAQW